MLFIVLIVSIVAILSFAGMVILTLLRLLFWILGVAGKATFSIARFGFKLSALAIVFAIAMLFCVLL